MRLLLGAPISGVTLYPSADAQNVPLHQGDLTVELQKIRSPLDSPEAIELIDMGFLEASLVASR
jgi:hypothetical protein